MAFSLHGVKVPHRKNTADCAAVRITDPKTVTLLTAMHIGKPAVPVVKVGDHVEYRQMIAKPADGLSVGIHASICGKVTEVTATHIVIARKQKGRAENE